MHKSSKAVGSSVQEETRSDWKILGNWDSWESRAVPDKISDISWELKDLEIKLRYMRNVIDLTMKIGDGCQDLWHNLRTCKHQIDWNTCQVSILPLHLPTWQLDNPWINPAWLFKERVMKTRLEKYEEKTLLLILYP